MDKNMNTANSCLLCRNALCQKYCPISTPIANIIELYRNEKKEEAAELLFQNNPLSWICSQVCDHERQCYGHCVKNAKGEPVAFFEIEKELSGAYIQDIKIAKGTPNGKRLGIIGGGPAGITVAIILAQRGYDITIFESNQQLGGVLRYGIPECRLSRESVNAYEELLVSLGVKIRPNTLIGPVLSIDRLLSDGYDALFIGTGVWNPKTLDIPGETLGHVHYAIDYLKSPHTYRLGKRVAVIGAGNVAMDAARTARQSGAEVTVYYRKSFEHMTAIRGEIELARQDQVQFCLYRVPVKVVPEGIIMAETETLETDGKAVSRIKAGSEKLIPCDSIIIAVSQRPQSNIVSNTQNLNTDRFGLLIIDEKGNTTRSGVFGSGDVVTGARTVVEAIAHAKVVAETIDQYCNKD